MKIDTLVVGEYQTNCYIVRENEDAKTCIVIDTGLEGKGILDFLNSHQLSVEAIVLTHGHADHIKGTPEIKEQFPQAKVCIHPLDKDMLNSAATNLSMLTGNSFTIAPPDILLEDESFIEYANIKLKVLHTPGHTKGCVSFYNEADKVAFVGDTLFHESVGRTDLPGGSIKEIRRSIREKLFTLGGDTLCLTGHGEKTTIGHEQKHNPFL